MINVIVILIVIAAVVPAVLYMIKAKKRGQACIGCPNSGKCGSACNCGNSENGNDTL